MQVTETLWQSQEDKKAHGVEKKGFRTFVVENVSKVTSEGNGSVAEKH